MNISPNDIEKRAKEQKVAISKERMNNEQLRKEVDEREQRFYKREKEYREIIGELQKQLK